MRRRAVLLATALTLVAGVVVVGPAPPAVAATGDIQTFGTTNMNGPDRITLGPDGNTWFTAKTSNRIGRITVNGTITTFTSSTINAPVGITSGPDNNLWFTNSGSGANLGSIGRITPAGIVTRFTNPGINHPTDITVGPDNALWFTNGNGTIGRMTTAGVFTFFSDVTLDLNDVIRGIITGPDNNLWFGLFKGTQLGRLTPAGVFTFFSDPNLSGPASLTVANGEIWFTSLFNHRLGRIDPTGNDAAILASFETFVDPGGDVDSPKGIATDPNGMVWFTDQDAGLVGRLDPTAVDPGATITTFPGAPNQIQGAGSMTRGPDGHMWFISFDNNKIGQVRTVDCNVDPFPHGFSDVPLGSFYEDGLKWAKCHDLVSGFPEGTYHPNDTVNRGQIVSILWVMMGSPPGSPPHGFPDIPANVFYEQGLRWAKAPAQHLVTGFPDHKYHPRDPVNRCQLTNMLWNMVGAPPGPFAPHGYTDVRADSFCTTAVQWAKTHGLWDNVVTGTTFLPKQGATRGQVVDVLYRLASTQAAWSSFTGQFPDTVRFN